VSVPADKHFKRYNGVFAITAQCSHCKHMDIVRKERPGMAGRGWGMREGNKQRGRMIQHVKAEHPDVLN
jgi:hypothetical protein